MSDQMAGAAEELVLEGSSAKGLSIGWSWGVMKEACGLGRSHRASVQLVRSLVVSVIALVVDFGSLIVFKEAFGINYLVAAALGFLLGVVTNYALSTWWVFADRKLTNKHAEFVFFVIICAIGLGLNLVIIAGLVQIVSFDYRLAKAMSSITVFFWNFLARKKFLY